MYGNILIMRMWMVNPKYMCNRHLVGEHGEIHKHRHNFVKHHSIDGRMKPVVQIEPFSMKKRHDLLVEEMEKRGMNHQSPYAQPDLSYLPKEYRSMKVNINQSSLELFSRCDGCRKKFMCPHDTYKGGKNEKGNSVFISFVLSAI